jgi:hypothetical protein
MLTAPIAGATVMSDRHRFYIAIADFARAHGEAPELRFEGVSPEALAEAVQAALRTPVLFERWRQRQPDPDEVDPALGVIDLHAGVDAEQADLHVELRITTALPMRVLRHRLNLLIGSSWTLRDVRGA